MSRPISWSQRRQIAEVLRRAQERGVRRRQRERPRDGLQLLAGLAIHVDAVGLERADRLAARGRGAQPVGLSRVQDTCARHDSQDPGGIRGASVRLRRVKVLIFHGYLLRGTGSQRLQRQPRPRRSRGLGHEVHLLCQDRDAGALDWVDRVGSWDGRRAAGRAAGGGAGAGLVTVYRPDIGGLLPVYVADEYEGFRGQDLPGADRRRARRLHGGQRRGGPRRRRARRAASTPRSPTT